MQYIISQICGLLSSAGAILSMQFKNVKYVLICLLICNGIGALSYILLGVLLGCCNYLLAVAQAIVYYIFRQKEKEPPLLIGFLFMAAFALCTALTYSGFQDIFAFIAAMTFVIGVMQEKSSKYRILMLMNGAVWMIYDISVGAYTMLLSHFATLLSALIGIVRLDLKRRKNQINN